MKNLILILGFSMVGCAGATLQERCAEPVINPHGLRVDMTDAELAEMGNIQQVMSETTFEFQRYGSMEACVASKQAQDNANAALFAQAFNAAAGVGSDKLSPEAEAAYEAHKARMANQEIVHSNKPQVIVIQK